MDLLRRWFFPADSAPRRRAPCIRHCRPRLEVLESRHMLAVLGLGIRLLADDGSATPGAEISSVTEDSKFWVEVLVEDQRSNPATQQGVISLPVNFSWNPNRIELVSAPAAGTVGLADPLMTLQFPLNRFLQSFDASAGYSSDPNSDMITVTANPNMGSLRGASLPNAMEGTAIGKTSGDEFSLLHFQALPGATADNTPFTMQVAGSMSFADADLLNGVNTLINTNRLSRNNFSPLEDQEQLAVTEFIGIVPPNLTITKTDNHGGSSDTLAVGTAIPGTSIVYTITVTNNGPNDDMGGNVSDLFTSNPKLTSDTFTVVGTGGAVDTTHPAAGNGDINDTVNVPVGGSLVYTVTAQISPSARGILSNTATTMLPGGMAISATDTDNLTPNLDLAITKTDDHGGSSITGAVGTVIPGTPIIYTITVTNSGPSDDVGGTVSDLFTSNSALKSGTFTVVGTGGAADTTHPTGGTGDINDTVNVPVGGSLVYTVTVPIRSGARGILSNTATATADPGETDTNPANNSATDTDNLTPNVDLAITKTDDHGGSSITGAVGTVIPGTPIIYTIAVTNSGPSDDVGGTVSDLLTSNPDLESDTFTVAATGGAADTTHPTGGTGDINDTINVPVGGSLIYTVTAQILSAATGILSNTGTAAADPGETDTNPANNSALDTDNLTPATSSLSGFVYADSNFNGMLDRDSSGQATEFGLPNVTITLSGTQSQVTTTGADGAYHFENLPTGTYNLIETLPAHYVHTSLISPFGNSVGMILPDDGVTLPAGLSPGTPGPSQISSIVLPSGSEGVDYNFGLNAIPDKRFLLASTDIRLLLAGQLGVTAVTVAGTAGTPITVSADGSQLTVTGTTGGTQQFPLSSTHELIVNASGADVTLNGTAEGEVADLSPGGGASPGTGALRVGKDYTGAHFAVLALGTPSVTANGTTGHDLAILRAPSGDAVVAGGTGSAANNATLTSADSQQALVAGFDSLDTVRAISLDDNDTKMVLVHNYTLKLVGKWM